jgi:hypothetical protein
MKKNWTVKHSIIARLIGFCLLVPQLSLGENVLLETLLAKNSEKFLGLQYGTSPLGEDKAPDTDPLIRFDVFDCTTYVETVMALSIANPSDVVKVLNQIRYADGVPSIETRNHFTSLDWIPNNVKKGFLKDITFQTFPTKSYQLQTLIDKKTWFQKNLSIDVEESEVSSKLSIIKISEILENERLLEQIPNGTVINFVTKNKSLKEKIGTDLDIVHQGLVFWVDGELVLRHARNHSYGVVEDRLIDYLKKTSMNDVYAINLLQVQNPL